MLLAIPFGLAIGLIVGAVGGGGAILALPVLVYVLGEPVGPASTASLIVVALAAAIGAGALARHGHVCWRLAVAFSLPAAAASLLGTIGARHVSGHALILAFVPIMLIAAGATWQRSGATRGEGRGECPPVALARVLAGATAAGPSRARWSATGCRSINSAARSRSSSGSSRCSCSSTRWPSGGRLAGDPPFPNSKVVLL